METVSELSRTNVALFSLIEALALSCKNVTKGMASSFKNSTRGKIAPPPQSHSFLSLTTCARGCNTVAGKWNGIIVLRLYLYHGEQEKLS